MILALAGLMGAASVSASFAAYSRTVELSSGTVIPVKLNQTLSSNHSYRGEPFSATVTSGAVLPAGTKIKGEVLAAHPLSGKNPGTLDLAFRDFIYPNGHTSAISGSPISLDGKSVTRTSNGRFVAKPGHKTNRLTYVGYGAGAGLLVSALTHGNTIKDTAIGGGLGYLFGALQKSGSRPNNVTLKAGTKLGVRLNRSTRALR